MYKARKWNARNAPEPGIKRAFAAAMRVSWIDSPG
jgi:hypothetical protein